MTERAQALEAAIEKARRGLIGFAAEIQDGRVPVVGAVRDHLVLNLGLIASFLADALEGSQPPPPVGSPTMEDVTCEHGTAMDVHCCNCHGGFIFDMSHECPAPELTWREAVEQALGVESDPENHTPQWAFDVVRAIREVGNQSSPVEPAGTPTLQDALSALRYIRETHGALYGVGWDRLLPVEPAGATPASEDEDDDDVPRERPEGAPDAWTAPLRKPVAPKILSTDDFYALLRILEVLPADPFLSAMQAKLSDEERRQHGNQASHLSGSEFVREIERIEALIQSRVRVKPAGASEPLKKWIPTEGCTCYLCRAARLSPAPVSPVEPTGHNDLCSWCLTQADHVAASEECYERNSERGRSASKPVEPTPEPPQDGGNPK